MNNFWVTTALLSELRVEGHNSYIKDLIEKGSLSRALRLGDLKKCEEAIEKMLKNNKAYIIKCNDEGCKGRECYIKRARSPQDRFIIFPLFGVFQYDVRKKALSFERNEAEIMMDALEKLEHLNSSRKENRYSLEEITLPEHKAPGSLSWTDGK